MFCTNQAFHRGKFGVAGGEIDKSAHDAGPPPHDDSNVVVVKTAQSA